MYKGSSFSISLPTLIYFFFWNRHPNGYKVVSHCDFSLHFPNDLRIHEVWHLFMCLLAICMSSVHFLWLELSHKQQVTTRMPERCSLAGLCISYPSCLITLPLIYYLKTKHFLCHSSCSQKPGHSQAGFFARLQWRCWLGLQSSLRLNWGRICFWLLAEFSSLQL